MPHPETAVNAPAASIVSRMKARLSIARTCSAGGSVGGVWWSGVTDAMTIRSYRLGRYLSSTLHCKAGDRFAASGDRRSRPARLLPQSDWTRQGVAGREGLFHHFVEAPLVDRARQELHQPRAKR